MPTRYALGWVLALLAVIANPMLAQRGARPTPPRRPPPPVVRPVDPRPDPTGSPTVERPGGFEAPGRETDRQRIERELEVKSGREPTKAEVDSEVARQSEARKEQDRQEERKIRLQEAAEQNFVSDYSDFSNLIVLPATAPPPTNFRVRVRAPNERGANHEVLSRVDAEQRLRDMLARHEQIAPYRVRRAKPPPTTAILTALVSLESAVFIYQHGSLPNREPVRYLKYDPSTGVLGVYADAARNAAPERTWKLVPNPEGQTLAEMRIYLRASGQVICYCPMVPQTFKDTVGEVGIAYVRGVEGSANNTQALRLSAMQHGERSFDPQRAELLDGLPNIRPGILGVWDAWRMNLDFRQRGDWVDFRRNLELPAAIPTRPASARELMKNLREGEKDVLLVVAHNDGTFVYMPNRERVAFSDIASLKRDVAPDRAVVLITCEGAKLNEQLQSLTQILLQNRLARTVYASESAVDARQLPDILRQLSGPGTYRDALRKFRFDQFVEYRHDHSIHGSARLPRFLRSGFPHV
jgi:hypothetical protein